MAPLNSPSKLTLKQRSEKPYHVHRVLLDQEEFLYLINLAKSKKVKYMGDDLLGEQPWLNEVYRWEKFYINSEYNLMPYLWEYGEQWISKLNISSNIYKSIQNATVVHFTGANKMNNCQELILKLCNRWNNYKEKLLHKKTSFYN